MTKAKSPPETISDDALDDVAGGALLLPAVQAAREAARGTGGGGVVFADGSVRFSKPPSQSSTDS